ncbi:MAG: hypothetical protein SFY69_06525 [Planctomycetota bacterium]|nr:hypothetical protein [Planctomycetota bacterium]
MERSRLIALVLAATSGVAAVACAVGVARAVADFHKRNPREVFAFKKIEKREFTFSGRPVSLTDDRSNPDQAYLVVTYGDTQERLRVTVPGDWRLPDLLPHKDWLRVLVFAPASGLSTEAFLDEFDRVPDNYRLVIVTRTPRAGVDPETWGAAWKRDWVFDFYEFDRGGGFVRERLNYPKRGGIREPRPGELRENTWQFQAALQLMPQAGGVGPTRNFFGDALSAAGWLLPGAAFAGAIFTFSTAFVFAPRRRA